MLEDEEYEDSFFKSFVKSFKMKSLPIKNILKNLHIYFYGKKRDNPIMDDPKIIFAHFPD